MTPIKTFRIPLLGIVLLITACASNQQAPLVFGQSNTLGISIAGGASQQGADFTLGYKSRNIAVVPVTAQTSPNETRQIGSAAAPGEFEDAFSVLGQFDVKTDTTQGNVGLGTFFATGGAAKTLADGFSCKLAADANFCDPSKQQ